MISNQSFFDNLVKDLVEADNKMSLDELGTHLEIISKKNGVDIVPTYEELLHCAMRYDSKGDKKTANIVLDILEKDLKEKENEKYG